MIIEEINNLIKNVETINEDIKPKGTSEGLKNIGRGTMTLGKGAIQAWKPITALATGATLYHLGRNSGMVDQKYSTDPVVAGLGLAGGAAGMHYLHKKINELPRSNI